MPFPTRSLSEKLTVVVAFTLLLSLLLFSALSFAVLNLYTEYQAKKGTQSEFSQLQQAYQQHINQTFDALRQSTRSAQLQDILSSSTSTSNTYLNSLLITHMHTSRITSLHVLSPAQKKAVLRSSAGTHTLSNEAYLLAKQAFLGQNALAFGETMPQQQLVLYFALPIQDQTGSTLGTLMATQDVDSSFAQQLTDRVSTHVLLCFSNRLIGKTLPGEFSSSQSNPCTSGTTTIQLGSQHFAVTGHQVTLTQQHASTRSLFLATLQPISFTSSFSPRLLLLFTGLSLCALSISMIFFVMSMRSSIIYPLQQLEFQLQNSLQQESQTLIDQMSNSLILSDALMSTLNLEHLLKEFVSHIGHVMQVQHVSLLLYGRENQHPWAIAHWSGTLEDVETQPLSSQQKPVSVFIHPHGDITTAVTTKLAAIPRQRIATTSTKRSALRISKLVPKSIPLSSATPWHLHMPAHALRDVDVLLARMTMQRQKIVYGEDIAAIYQQRQELWARLALDVGYQSAIAVPFLLQDHAIGAFILYTDTIRHIHSKDTFLLSTAALQTSMAIENALLFAEVKEKNAALERANQLKTQFLANVTHELRTPLHSIISYGALILEGFVDGTLTSEQEQHIQFMVRRAEDLSHLVDDMLDLSKIEANRIEVKLAPVSLSTCLHDVVDQLKPLAHNKDLHLTLEIEADIPEVLADVHRLKQVVINLVSNALKFTEQGGVTLRCVQLFEHNVVQIIVQDTGIGISPASLSYIFEAFRQADDSTTRRFGGTGLGLTIAKKLIELQAGELSVESVPGEGSSFSLTLPMMPV